MKSSLRTLSCLAIVGPLVTLSASAQTIGVQNGFPYTADPQDTVLSEYLPSAQDEIAGEHGFVVKNAQGDLEFQDGTPIRFMGMSVVATAAFPDSLNAISEAKRLRKLGVNLIRFRYIDYSYNTTTAYSILNPDDGFRSISPEQAKRFDWYVYQLKQNGIYVAIPMLGIRYPRPEDGYGEGVLDTVPSVGYGFPFIYDAAKEAHKVVTEAILNHVNEYTGLAYKDEPSVAFIELMHRRAMTTWHRIGYDTPESIYSWRHSRRVDTIYNEFLMKEYGSSTNLKEAWEVTQPEGGYPDLVSSGGFEANEEWDRDWELLSNGSVSSLPVLVENDSVPEGESALSFRIRDAQGSPFNAYMYQPIDLSFGAVYRLSFWAKGSNPDGRIAALRVFARAGGIHPGVAQNFQITDYWQQFEAYFPVPVDNGSNATTNLYLYFGDKDGEITFDQIELREVSPNGLDDGESLENFTVKRLPWAESPMTHSSQRFMDQGRFYQNLDRDYYRELKSFVHDTIGAQQLVTAGDHLWASTIQDVASHRDMDLTISSQGWDFVRASGDNMVLSNTSHVQTGSLGPSYYHSVFATSGTPMITSLSTPYPNRYQAETFLVNPAWMLFQAWDGFLYEYWDNSRFNNRRDYIDSADYYSARNNPVISALFPSLSKIVTEGLISPGETTINILHTEEQMHLAERFAGYWGIHGVPGGTNGRITAMVRWQHDSLDASEFTQANDYGLPQQADGEVLSDTRELLWEYARGSFTIDNDHVQAATGYLYRPGGINLNHLEIELVSLNNTATVLWVPVDTAVAITEPGRSLLTLITRTETNGWVWQDSNTVGQWGAGPMLIEPMNVNLTFKAGPNVKQVKLTPLDEQGLPKTDPVIAERDGAEFSVSIDQRESEAVWYSVELIESETGVDAPMSDAHPVLSVYPSIASERVVLMVQDAPTGSDLRVTLHDITGREVRTIDESNETVPGRFEISVADMQSGVYYFNVASDGRLVGTSRVTVAR